jgi:hypothetical protein
MTYENFSSVIQTLESESEKIRRLHREGISLIDFMDPYYKVITLLLKEIYTPDGVEWFEWYCYDNDFGRKDLQAWDERGNKICYDIKSLWEHIEELKNSEE